MDQRLTYLAYVRHDAVLDYLRLGWVVTCDLGSYHGQFAVAMQWLCACDMKRPARGLHE